MRNYARISGGHSKYILATLAAAAWPVVAQGANDPYQTFTNYQGYITTFDNPTAIWYGSNVALVLDDTSAAQAAAYNQNTMTQIVTTLGNMYTTYEQVTGFTNIPVGSTNPDTDGLITIEASNNIGGGLGGSTALGIGVGEGFFTDLYGRVNTGTNTYDQVFFYEAQRNFWVPQLMQKIDAAVSNSPSDWGWWTVAFNNAMAAIMPPSVPGMTDMYYYGENGSQFAAGMVANLTTYINNPAYTWANSWDVERVPWNTNTSVNDLETGLLITLADQYGGLSYMSGLYHQIPRVPDLASAHADTQGAMDNFYIAASRAAGVDLRSYFVNTLRWNISPDADANYQMWSGATNAKWDTASNWIGLTGTATAVPTGSTVDVAFDGDTNTNVDLHGNQTVRTLRFDGLATGAFNVSNSVSGASLTIAAGGGISKDINTVDNNQTIATPIILAGDATFANNNAMDTDQNKLIISGAITGSGTLHITGRAWDDGTGNDGGVELSASNTNFTGTVSVDSGRLIVNNNNALGTGAGALVNGGIVWFAAGTNVLGNFTIAGNSTEGNYGPNALAGNVQVNSGITWTITNGGGNAFNMTGAISGPGNIYMQYGATTLGGFTSNTLGGLITLASNTGNPNYDTIYLDKTGGATAIAGGLLVQNLGTVVMQGNNQISNSSLVTLDGNSTSLQLQGHSDTIGGLLSGVDGAGIVENQSGASNTGTLTVNPASLAFNTFAGILRDGDGVGTNGKLAFTVSGTGVQALSGINTYTGFTTVHAGTLLVNGAGSINNTSEVTVNGGSFFLNSSVALTQLVNATSGTVGGTGTFTGGITLTSAILSPGYGGIGKLTTSSLSLTSGSSLDFDIDPVNHLTDSVAMTGALVLDGTLNLNDLSSGVLPQGTYVLISGFTSLTDNGLALGSNTSPYELSVNTTTHQVDLTVVPEPSSLMLLVGGAGLLSSRSRRRRA